jgi:hypothetical protein
VSEARDAAAIFEESSRPGECDACGATTKVATVEDCFYFPHPQTIRQQLCWEHWLGWLLLPHPQTIPPAD